MPRDGERRAKTCLVLCPGWDPNSPALGPALLKSFLLSRGYEAATVDLGPLFLKTAPGELGEFMRHGDMAFLQTKMAVAAMLARMSTTVDEALQRILACEPDVVGFTVYFTTWHMSVMLAQRLKELNPRISIVLGGPEGMRYFNLGGKPMDGQDELDAVDAVIPGEGELPLLNLLSNWNKKRRGFKPCPGAHVKVDGRFVWTEDLPPIQDLDSLPFPDFDGFEIGDYGGVRQLATYFSRGCFKKCVYCDVENYWKNWRNRSGVRVVDEIEHLAVRHPDVTNFFFGDSLLNADMKGLLQFCRLMKERTAGGRLRPIDWRGYAVVRPDMTADACREMKAAGCSELWFGIESGSQRVLDAMKKGCRVAAADAVLENCRAAGIRTMVLLMVGFPTETAEDFDETLSFVRRNSRSISTVASGGNTWIANDTALEKNAFTVYGVAEDQFHPRYWKTRDGINTFPERVRRLELLSRCCREMGIHQESNLRPETLLPAYEEWRRMDV
jgi:radical SAM superfamily enzyme YgiQ (UPF0313 family)